MNWICKTDTLIIPALENKKIPPSSFSFAKRLITVDWNKSFTEKNLNKTVFPNVHVVLILNSNKIINTPKNPPFKLITGYEEGIITEDCIRWNNVMVNTEWLESQYHEYICAIQEFNELRENELQ